jgi:hypothetical protein
LIVREAGYRVLGFCLKESSRRNVRRVDWMIPSWATLPLMATVIWRERFTVCSFE